MKRHPYLWSTACAVVAGLALCGSARMAAAHGHGDFAAIESAAFTEADADGDGKLTPAEFTNFHNIMRQKLEALHFSHLDTDGDGAVSKAELDAGRPHGHHGFPGPGM